MEHLQGALPLFIGGKARTLYFDYTFVSIMQSLTGEGAEAIQNNATRLIPLITMAALQAGDDENDLPENLTERQVSRWLIQLSAEDNGKILACYQHSMGFIAAVYNGMAKATAVVAGAKSNRTKS